MNGVPRRQLTGTGDTISSVGFGCSSFWSKPLFNKTEAVSLVKRAAEAGVNYFDTGSSYSAGEAELRLGAALEGLVRDDLIISSKVGTVALDGKLLKDFSPEAMEDSLLGSLNRLGTDYLDIVYLHGPKLTDLNDTTLKKLSGFKDRGLARFIGVNAFEPEILEACMTLPLDGVMLQYNVIDQAASSMIDRFTDADMFVVGATAVGQALYSWKTFGGFTAKSLWYLMRVLAKHRGDLRKARKYSFMNEHPSLSPAQVALAFSLTQKKISSCVFGTTSQVHLEDNINAAQYELESDYIDRIRSLA